MAKPFDASSKNLIEYDPIGWLRFLGLPGERAIVVEGESNVVTVDADRYLLVFNPDYLAHFEAESNADPTVDMRVLLYHVLGKRRYDVEEVRSILLLLRPEADHSAITGRIHYGVPGNQLLFEYTVVRVWEIPADAFLNSAPGLLPFAPIADLNGNDLGGVVRQMKQRMETDVPPQDHRQLWSLTELLMGLKYSETAIEEVMMGIFSSDDLKDSVIYQKLLREGRAEGIAQGRTEGIAQGRTEGIAQGKAEGIAEGKAEGKAEGERGLLMRQGEKKFGAPNAKTRKTLESITSPERLEELSLKLLDANSWQELLN